MAGTSTHTHTVWMPEAFAVTGAWPVPSVDATMPPHRILIVDDSRTFREAAARFLSRHPDMVVVGHASSGEDALSQTDRLRPDLVLMDLTMPGMNGLEATRRLKARPGAPRVVILSLHDSEAHRAVAAAAGADAYASKSEFGDALLGLIQALLA